MRKFWLVPSLLCLWATPALAQEQPATGQPPSDAPATASDEGNKNESEQITAMIQANQLADAAKAVAESTTLDLQQASNLRRLIVMGYARANKLVNAVDVLQADLDANLAAIGDRGAPNRIAGTLSLLNSYAARTNRAELLHEYTDRVLSAFSEMIPTETFSAQSSSLVQTALLKARLLAQGDDLDGAKALVAQYLEHARRWVDSQPEMDEAKVLLVDTMLALRDYSADLPEQAESLYAEAKELLNHSIDASPNNGMLVSKLATVLLNKISQSMRDNPDQAEELLTELKSRLESLPKDDATIARIVANYSRQLDSFAKRIESAKILAKLVGSPAPAIDAGSWVHGDIKGPEELAGKVVMLDFWAVWCGPCIATFPHLKEWQAEFADQGFQVVGVTRKYGYRWDVESNRTVRVEGDEATDEAELVMLDQFMTHHELPHPTIMAAEDSQMHQQFAVSGIPHAVLIDKKGIVRMIKVGSGEANAHALHDMIVELLAE